jgi:heme-degrading monooxygenase HmoA
MIRTALIALPLLGVFVMSAPVAAQVATKKNEKVLRHVVLVKFKDDATKDQVQEVVTAFRALPKKIDAIIGFEDGTDVSSENLAQGFTHGFIVTFRDEKGRDAYLPHPEHEAFKKVALTRVDKVLVFDFWTAK